MNICLYGASSTELDARYLDAAYDLGRRIAAGGHTSVLDFRSPVCYTIKIE